MNSKLMASVIVGILILLVILVTTAAAGCPTGHNAACPSASWAIDGTPQEIKEQGLSGCVWYCKCASGCFACDDNNGNTAADIHVGLSLASAAAYVEAARQYVSTFITSRYNDALDRSCAVSQRKSVEENARDETLLSVEEGEHWKSTQFGDIPPHAQACCDALANQNQCSSTCDAFFDEFAGTGRNFAFDADPRIFKETSTAGFGFGRGNNNVNPRKPCSEWMQALAQAQQDSDGILDGWCFAAYTQAHHTNAMTEARREAIRNAIQTHADFPADYTVNVIAKQHGSSCDYGQVQLVRDKGTVKWDLRYDVLLTHSSSSTDLTVHPLLISKVASRKDGPILARKFMMACKDPIGGLSNNDLKTSGSFSALSALIGKVLNSEGQQTALSFEGKWNQRIKELEPIVRGAINEARFDILGDMT